MLVFQYWKLFHEEKDMYVSFLLPFKFKRKTRRFTQHSLSHLQLFCVSICRSFWIRIVQIHMLTHQNCPYHWVIRWL